MLDPNLTELARNRIMPALAKLDADLQLEWANIPSMNLATPDPSPTPDQIRDVQARYFERRVRLIWQAIKQVAAAGRVQYSATLASDLKAELRKYATPAHSWAGVNVAAFVERSLQEPDSDIDLYVLELKRVESQPPHPQPPVIFNAPVGAVQTGAGSTAYVEQHIGAEPPLQTGTRDGLISVGGISFATDANLYVGPQLERRYSTHPVIGGGHVTQDFGAVPSRHPIRLRSGNKKLDKVTMQRLQDLSMQRRPTHSVTDYIDNEYLALIGKFTPKSSDSRLWTYEMELVLTRLIKLHGLPYTGDQP